MASCGKKPSVISSVLGGDKLELLTGPALHHGEAVAIGMELDACYSVEARLLDEDSLAAIVGLLERLGLPVWDDALREPASLVTDPDVDAVRICTPNHLQVDLARRGAARARGRQARDLREATHDLGISGGGAGRAGGARRRHGGSQSAMAYRNYFTTIGRLSGFRRRKYDAVVSIAGGAR